jgi:NADH-quinone oxidoreductase subunit M
VSWILTILVFLPTLGALAVMVAPEKYIKWTATVFSAATFIISLWLYIGPVLANKSFGDVTAPYWVDRAPWIDLAVGTLRLKIEYHLAADGLSVFMMILNALLTFLAIIGSWNISKRPREYNVLILLLATGVMGVFCAFDLFLFWLVWEIELIPMFLLIAIWGGARREYAAWKFVIYTILGSALMLGGILLLYFNLGSQTGTYSADFGWLATHHLNGNLTIFGTQIAAQLAVFLLIFAAFGIKLPMVPFHTWLPDAHTEAPTSVSVLLAGVLLKMGAYGIIRINLDFLPDGSHQIATLLAVLGAVNVVYGAVCSLVQSDMKKMIAYSSVSHMGYVLVGIAAAAGPGLTNMDFKEAALTGAAVQMFAHGTITGMLFFCVGVVYDRAHMREINAFGGLQSRMPRLTWIFSFALLASLGLPGLSGFIAEYLVYTGTYAIYPGIAIASAFAMIITAGYLLWMFKRAFYGPLNPRWASITDASLLEMTPLIALAVLVIFVGIYPKPLVDMLHPSLHQILQTVSGVITTAHH